MDVRRLELLRELAERGSITGVARATHRTPSAVSQQLKVLEREAGIPLIERSGRGIALTGAGRALARTAADVAVAIARAEALWEDFRDAPAGEVSLTTFATAGQMLLPGLLSAVESIPGLSLVCSDQDPLRPDFTDLTHDHDVVVADSPDALPSWTERGLVVVPLLREPLDVALPDSHRLAGRARVTPADLVDETWIGTPEGTFYDPVVRRVGAASGAPVRVGQRFLDNGIVESVVAAGHGIAVLPRYTTRSHENGLVTVPLHGVRAIRQISALLRPDRAERPSVRRVVEELRREADRVQALHGQG